MNSTDYTDRAMVDAAAIRGELNDVPEDAAYDDDFCSGEGCPFCADDSELHLLMLEYALFGDEDEVA